MKINKKLNSVALALTALSLFFIFVSSAAYAATEQGTPSAGTYYAYIITGDDSDTVSVIDTATNNVTATVDVGDGPFGVAVSPDGTKVYVTHQSNTGHVSVIDTATNKVTATVPVGSYPAGVAVTPNGKKVYVANDVRNNGTVSVIDTATNNVTATVPVGSYPIGVAVNKAGTKVYVGNRGSDTVSVIDTATNKVKATVKGVKSPFGIAVSPDGSKVYLTNEGKNGIVSVIDTATNKVQTTLGVKPYPLGVAVSPDGSKLYVTSVVEYPSDWGGGAFSVIDTATYNAIAIMEVGYIPDGVAVTPDGTKIYVTNEFSDTVSIIDAATNKVTATVNVGSYPFAFGQFIGPISPVPVANFSASPTSGKAPLTVAFTDKSTRSPTKWKWTFGDGTTSTQQNPTHKYSKAGEYTVTLVATNNNGSNTVTKSDYIKVATKPVANFTSSGTYGKAPFNVTFTDTSTEIPTGWKWDFGDGSKSFLQNPIHKYSNAGIYTVSLTAKNTVGSNTVTKTDYIKVVTKPVAAFSAKPTSGKVPLIVAFTDKSTGIPTKWKWSFGDGKTSTVQNPKHQYLQEGKYKVTLTVTNVAGSNTTTKTNYITVTTNTRPGIYSENK
ncbi:MAG: PKD domain-containing protein [Methanosarcina vacuolata]|nr:PKD domain-containing protein [Methanosarcina vacuolata]